MWVKLLLKYKVFYKSLVLLLLTWIWSVRMFYHQALANRHMLYYLYEKVLSKLRPNYPKYLGCLLLNSHWSFHITTSAQEPNHSSFLHSLIQESFIHSKHLFTDSFTHLIIHSFIHELLLTFLIQTMMHSLEHAHITQANIYKDFLLP